MKKDPYVMHLLVFMIVMLASSFGFVQYANVAKTKAAVNAKEVMDLRTKQRDLKRNQDLLRNQNEDSIRLQEYRQKWIIRRQEYDKREKIAEIFRSESANRKLVSPEDELNKVLVNEDNHFRVEWRVVGSPIDILEWVASIEEKIDFMSVTSTEWEVTDNGGVEALVTGDIRLP